MVSIRMVARPLESWLDVVCPEQRPRIHQVMGVSDRTAAD